MAIPVKTLKKLLIESSIIEEDEFLGLAAESKRTGLSIDRLLISQGRLTESYLNQIVSKFLEIPYVDFQRMTLDPTMVSLVPEEIAREHEVIVFDKDKKKESYKVAMADPTNIDTINFLKEYLNGDIECHLASRQSLQFAYQIYKRHAVEDFETVIEAKVNEVLGSLDGDSTTSILETVPLTELLDNLLDYGVTLNASDIYIQPEEAHIIIRFRVDGLLRDITSVDKRIHEGIVARVKVLSGLRIDEHMRPQDGRFKFQSSTTDVDVRTATIPTFFGEKITMRLLPGAAQFVSFEELGVDNATTKKLHEESSKPFGMILSSGPTGSGKTTTIYSVLNMLNRADTHITTIEDPIEYVIPRVSQTQVNEAAGITFASGLRSLLRHSPDIIVVGEIRDAETAEISIHAALTGHLLISTIHTNNAVGVIPRLLDLGVPAFFVASTLNAILAQRLVRRICNQCITSYSLTNADKKALRRELTKTGKKYELKTAYHGQGCKSCGLTGYKGRIGIFELLVVNEDMRKIINSDAVTTDKLLAAAIKQGMQTMFSDGINKIEKGITTIEELFRAVRE